MGQSEQNSECWGQFSVFEATSRASYNHHLLKYDKLYPIFPPKILGKSDQNCECWGQFSAFEATSKASYDCHLLQFDKTCSKNCMSIWPKLWAMWLFLCIWMSVVLTVLVKKFQKKNFQKGAQLDSKYPIVRHWIILFIKVNKY